MSTLELFVLAVGLSMDAFAVAICKGLSVKKLSKKPNYQFNAYLILTLEG